MRLPPDVTAREVNTALKTLAEEGWKVADILETRPPFAGPGKGAARVARLRVVDGGAVQLVLVYPEYGPRTQG